MEVFMDDILVYGTSMEQHDARLERVLQRIESAGFMFNKEKCSFKKSQLRFLGHLIDQSGIRPDPEKVGAIQQLPPPAGAEKSPWYGELSGKVCPGPCNSRTAIVRAPEEQEHLDLRSTAAISF